MGEAPGKRHPADKTAREEPKLQLFGPQDTTLPMNDRVRKPKFRRGGGKTAEKGHESGRRPPWRGRDPNPDGPAILYGWHTVAAALANPQRHIRKLMLTENAPRRLADENIATRRTPEVVAPRLLHPRLRPD